MKRLIYFIIASLFVGCAVDTTVDELNQLSKTPTVFTVAFDESTTKTYVGESGNLYWTKGDMLSIFTTTLNEKYAFDGNTGDNSATFGKINTGFGYGNPLSKNYGVYPYSSLTRISDNGQLSVVLPAKQAYAENSFGVNANTMVGVTKNSGDCFLPLKNVCGFLKIRLYGEGVTVKKIRLEGNNNEKIAGASTITADYGTVPTVEMSADATTMITLNCGDGVVLGDANNAKEFWIVVPPTLFERGFTVTVVDTDNMTFKQVSTNKQEIVRNTPLAMPAVKVVPTEPDTYEDEEVVVEDQPNNEIWYTSSDGRHIVPECTPELFGANVVDFIYEDGKGIIRFDGDVLRVGLNSGCEDRTGVFGYNENLTSISLPESVTTIGANAFIECYNLTTVVLREGLEYIGEGAFAGCRISKLTIPSTVKYLGAYSLAYNKFESIVVPNGITQILSSVFADCENLTAVTLPDNLVSIGYGAFSGTAISSIDIPDSVVSLGEYVFSYCYNLTDVVCPKKLQYIPAYAFQGCSGLVDLIIPDGITAIDNGVFSECENLKSVTIPNSVKKIGRGLFRECASLESVTLPAGLTTLPTRLFEYSGIKTFTIPESVTTIGYQAFAYCENLTELTIPDTVTTLQYEPEEGTEEDYYGEASAPFVGCSNLERLVLGKGITSVENIFDNDNYYNRYNKLKYVEIRGEVTALPVHCFYEYSSLENVVLPESLTTIGNYAFAGCSSLQNITIPNGVTVLPTRCFYECNSLESVVLPESLTTINEYAFAGCNSLQSITIPDSVTSIGNYAFAYSSLQDITIPSNVTSIGENAFYDCDGLTTVICEPTNPPTMERNALGYIYGDNFKIYVPQESYDSYKSASGWSSYSDYIVGWDMSKGLPKTFTFSVSDITTNSATIHVVPSDLNCTYYLSYASVALLENEYDGSIETCVNSYYNTLKSNVEANNYTWADVLYTGEKNFAFHSNDLVPGTSYYVFAFGVDATSGELTSAKPSYCLFETKYSSVNYYDWEGYWNVTSPQTLEQSTVDQQYTEVVIDSLCTRTIRIEYAKQVDEHIYMNIYDWDSNGNDSMPALAEWKGNSLEMINAYVGDFDDKTSACWLSFSSVQGYEGHYYIYNNTPYTFVMDDSGNNVTITGYSGKLDTGEAYEMKYFQLRPVDKATATLYNWIYDEPVRSLYGNTMTAVRSNGLTRTSHALSRSVPNTQLPAVSSQPTTNRISLPVKERFPRLRPLKYRE